MIAPNYRRLAVHLANSASGIVNTTPSQSDAESSQTPRPAFNSAVIKFPAPEHQVYDVINDTVEANEIPPEVWYPKGHMPELIREWPLTKDLENP